MGDPDQRPTVDLLELTQERHPIVERLWQLFLHPVGVPRFGTRRAWLVQTTPPRAVPRPRQGPRRLPRLWADRPDRVRTRRRSVGNRPEVRPVLHRAFSAARRGWLGGGRIDSAPAFRPMGDRLPERESGRGAVLASPRGCRRQECGGAPAAGAEQAAHSRRRDPLVRRRLKSAMVESWQHGLRGQWAVPVSFAAQCRQDPPGRVGMPR
jgi:hypothetical protein